MEGSSKKRKTEDEDEGEGEVVLSQIIADTFNYLLETRGEKILCPKFLSPS